LFPAVARFCITYALITFLPLPTFDGFTFLYYARLSYAFIFGGIMGYFVFASTGISVIGSLVLATLSAITACYLFYNFWEYA